MTNIYEMMMVSLAFDRFREQHVDLDPKESQRAVTSRDFLIQQIRKQAQEYPEFPQLTGAFFPYGSLSRKTKIRPLDDVDLMVGVNGRGTQSEESKTHGVWWLKIVESGVPLAKYKWDNCWYVNSTKVLNAIKAGLSEVEKYQQAELKKNMEAVVLNLESYDWNFDIVPTVPIAAQGRTLYHMIPDGTGNWKRTDPRIDAELVATKQTQTNQLFRPLCRLLKYWNKRTNKPVLPSYYFEILVLWAFQNRAITSLKQGVLDFFTQAPVLLYQDCPDPKRLGKNLDADVDRDTKLKVGTAMDEARKAATQAMGLRLVAGMELHELENWKKVFGKEYKV